MAFAKLTSELALKVRLLKAQGGTSVEIAAITNLPYAVIHEILGGAQWPKVVTRVREDGSWEIIKMP